jgi:uncharacterized repeat protein (TIGR02543 family)
LRYILLFLSLFTFIFSKDKEVENEMAIPSGYRAINSGDVGKQFGTHLDSTIYFDTSIHDDISTFPHIETTSNFEIVGHAGSVANYYSLIQDDDYNAPVASFYEYDIASEIGDWLSYESYNMGGYTITGVTEGSNAVVYVKPLNATFSVTFIENGGSSVDDVDGVTALPNPLPVPTKNGYTFAGWWNSDYSVQYTAGYTIYYNYTLYAKWTANLYDITYNSNGGSAVSSNVGVNAFPNPLPTTTKAGSTFAGWWNSNFSVQYTAGQPIYGSLTAYAKWIVNSYTVTWVENGGTPAPDDLTDVASLPATLPVITKTGYELDGWYFNSLFTGSAATPGQLITQNETLYAKFVRVSYVIGYELDGGTNNLGNPDEYNVESPTITLLDPSKAGYTFNGWFSDAEMTTAITSIPTGTTGDITIYASFTLSETGYSITWIENGGTPEQTDLTNQNYLPSVLPALYKANYVFKGWFTNEALTIAAAPSAIIGENTTLYAKFEAQSTPKKGYIRVEPIDTALSAVSKKPLQNKAIYAALALKFNSADLTREALVTLLGEATTLLNGLMSATDKARLDTIYASFNDTDENNVVDKISEILAIFENYPEADAIVTALSAKVDKTTTVNTKALSSNIVLSGADILVGGSTSANAASLISVAFKTLEDVDDTKVDKVDGKALSTNDYNDAEKALVATIPSISLKNGEQDKQIATIEENLRRVNNGEVSATVTGERVIYLGKDVANAPLKIETEGLLLNAAQLVPNGEYTYSGSTNQTNFILPLQSTKTKYYQHIQFTQLTGSITSFNLREIDINGDFVTDIKIIENITTTISFSGIIDTYRLTNRILGITDGYTYISKAWNISTLITNKQYSPLYSTTFDLMSDAEIKAQMDLWFANGTLPNDLMGVDFNKRFTSVGKNLFDKTKYATDYAYKIKVKPSTAYVWSASTAYKTYDNQGVEVASDTGTTKTTSAYTYYIAFSGVANVDTFQLEAGSTATTYVPFAKSEMYIAPNVKGYRLPNGVKDTIEYKNGKYYYVQRVQEYTLQASDVNGIDTSFNYVDWLFILKRTDDVLYNNSTGSLANSQAYRILGYSAIASRSSVVSTGYYVVNYSVTIFMLGVPKGTFADLAAAKTALAGTDIYYQLATPITTEITADGVLNGYENGTVYVENAVKDMAIYNSGFVLTNTNYPISELETIIKIDKITGLQTVYSASNAVVAGDKLSFTHSSLANGDLVYITYKYLSPLMSNTTITFIDNKQVVLGTGTSAGKYFKITPSVVDGAIVWVATEV